MKRRLPEQSRPRPANYAWLRAPFAIDFAQRGPVPVGERWIGLCRRNFRQHRSLAESTHVIPDNLLPFLGTENEPRPDEQALGAFGRVELAMEDCQEIASGGS